MGAGKWTPGPWVAIGTVPEEGGDWFWINAQPSPALRGFTKQIGVINGSQADPEQAANARLIAEAPAMAEAIADMLAAEQAGNVSEGGRVLERFRAILTRIHGEQP